MAKYLFCGIGNISRRHMRNLRDVDSTAEIHAWRHTGLDTDFYYTDIDLALEEHHYDAVFICTPSSKHIDLAIKVARKGVNLFIEKPLSHNMEGIKELEQLVKEKNIICAIGFQMRYHPCLQKLYGKLNSSTSELGKILDIRVEHGSYMPKWFEEDKKDYRETYAAREELGGGVILSQIHEFDYINWIFGNCTLKGAIGGKYSELELDVEDNVTALLKSEIAPITVHLDFLQKEVTRTIRVIAEKGTIDIDLIKGTFLLQTDTRKLASYTFRVDWNDLFMEEMKAFLDFIESDKSAFHLTVHPTAFLEAGIKSLDLALQIKSQLKEEPCTQN